MQDSCIGTHMAVCFAASVPLSPISGTSPHIIPPQLPYPLLFLPRPPTDPSLWCSPPCVHVFSLFNTCLWVRTYGVWFSVLMLVCWELWFPASSMSLQRTWSHPFLWLPWCICATFFFSQSITDGHLGWFQVFAIVNGAAINIRVCLYNKMIYAPLVYTQ